MLFIDKKTAKLVQGLGGFFIAFYLVYYFDDKPNDVNNTIYQSDDCSYAHWLRPPLIIQGIPAT